MIRYREATSEDAAAIVSLNEAVVQVTSPMDQERFLKLLQISHSCIVAEQDGDVIGFVLTMKAGAPYENQNFEWFSRELETFLYVDRIVIGANGKGKGLGSGLYERVMETATEQSFETVAAEMDLMPPNEPSLNFHRKMGFVEIGNQQLPSGKLVSMQVREL